MYGAPFGGLGRAIHRVEQARAISAVSSTRKPEAQPSDNEMINPPHLDTGSACSRWRRSGAWLRHQLHFLRVKHLLHDEKPFVVVLCHVLRCGRLPCCRAGQAARGGGAASAAASD
jgi:hypothetical protein